MRGLHVIAVLKAMDEEPADHEVVAPNGMPSDLLRE